MTADTTTTKTKRRLSADTKDCEKHVGWVLLQEQRKGPEDPVEY